MNTRKKEKAALVLQKLISAAYIQHMIYAAIAAVGSLQIKGIPGPGLNLGPSESRHFTTEQLRKLIPVLIIQLYLKLTACKDALNKHVSSATSNHWMFQLLLDTSLEQLCSTACAVYIQQLISRR